VNLGRQKKRDSSGRIFMNLALRIGTLICVALLGLTVAKAELTKRDADLSAPDGVKLKVTYFSAGKPGPGAML
jgi:hypothetical protein